MTDILFQRNSYIKNKILGGNGMINKKEILTNTREMRNMISNFGTIDKILVFTHVADADGMGCEVLSMLFRDLLLKYRLESFHVSNLLLDMDKRDYEAKKKLIDSILEIHRISYRNPSEEIKITLEKNSGKNCIVVITDISSSPELFKFIGNIDEPVLYIDHHEFSLETMKAYEEIIDKPGKYFMIESGTTGLNQFETSERKENLFEFLRDIDFGSLIVNSKLKSSKISATYIFWILILFLFPEIITNIDSLYLFDSIMKLISDADTYEWKKHSLHIDGKDAYGTSLFSTSTPDIFSLIFKYRGGDYLVYKLYNLAYKAFVQETYIRPEDVESIINENEVFVKCREHNYEYYKKSAQMFLSDKFGLAEVTSVTDADFSMFSNWRFSSNEKLDTTIMLYPDSRTISIRTRESSGINASEVMRELFNGGGHENAAGGKLDVDRFCNWLKFYWDLKAENKAAPMIDLKAQGLI